MAALHEPQPPRQDVAPSACEPVAKTVFDDIAHAHREIYALYEIAHAMGTSLGVSDTMTLIASKLTTLVPFSTCALFLYDEEQERLRCRFATGVSAERMQALEIRRGERLERPPQLRSSLAMPLIFRERFIGTLSVFHVEPQFYRDDHRRLMERVCEQAAAVINNSIVFEQTQEESLTDPLTALPNTRHLFKYLTAELARAGRLHRPLALMVMDLDGFKDVNDSHGHHVGDRALCEVARVLQAEIRPYDICVRYAGDEFIVVLAECGAEEAEAKRQSLQRAVDALVLEARPGKRLRLGVSVGTAVFPTDGESYEALLAAADRRMYQDKTARGAGRRQDGAALSGRYPLHGFSDTAFTSASRFDVLG